MRFCLLLGISLLGLVSLGALWNLAYPTYSVRYRLTLTVDDNGTPSVGSSVIQVDFHNQPSFLQIPEVRVTWKGDAVAVDLEQKGYLFTTLGGDIKTSWRSGNVYPDELLMRLWDDSGVKTHKSSKRVLEWSGHKNIPFSTLPLLITFRNTRDRLSASAVDPDNLASSFGPGVTLVSATAEITGDPITTGIRKKLPWMADGPPADGTLLRLDEINYVDMERGIR